MSNIVLKKVIKDIGENAEDTVYQNDFVGFFKKNGIYEIVRILGANQMIFIMLVCIFVYGFISHTSISISNIYGFILAGIVFFFMVTKWKEGATVFYQDKQRKLLFLNNILSDTTEALPSGALASNNKSFQDDSPKSYLYLNPAVVDLYYNHREFCNYSFAEYRNSLIACNQLILLGENIKISVANRGNQYEEAQMVKQKCLNHYQSIIYGLPSSGMLNKRFNESMQLLQKVLAKVIYDIEEEVEALNRQNGVNTEYYPIYRNQPKANDIGAKDFQENFSFFT